MCNKSVLKQRIASVYKALKTGKLTVVYVLGSIVCVSAGCVTNNPTGQTSGTAQTNSNSAVANANTNLGPAQPTEATPVTLPVLDAMFTDESFANELRSKLGLSDEQVSKLQQVSRDAVLSLDETDQDTSTKASLERARNEVKKIVGDAKANELFSFIQQRWSGEDQESFLARRPNLVPTDSRIVVNAPAYRMDVFKNGQLTRTYKVGIGYPEFPLPRGLRKADKIIFNPEWTPPDEPWVRGKFAPGKKVEAGSKDNPLGIVKIPIGLPSLIHGGKQTAKLGTFASHGCVGLTNQQVEMFATDLATLAGNQLTVKDVKAYQKNRNKTEELKLQAPVPVELRYETIVVEDGKVHIYRDVYELGTNTEEDLRRVLSAFDVNFDQLDENVKTQLLDALKSMAVDARGKPVTDDEKSKPANSKSGKVTSTIKGEKEIVVAVPQLAGKGYPAAVNFMG